MAEGKCGDPERKKAFLSSRASVCGSMWVCQIIQTPGWHGWVRDLAHNEGDVPQLLPVSDASLNQEWRERSWHCLQTSHSCCQGRCVGAYLCVCVCVSGYITDSESLVWYLFIKQCMTYFHADSVYSVCGVSVWVCLPSLTHFSSYNMREYVFRIAVKHCGFMSF